jgi:DnaJ-class molecular chaperone
LINHPDKFPEEERGAAHDRFVRVQQAYSHLSDAEKRRRYDAVLNNPYSDDDEDADPFEGVNLDEEIKAWFMFHFANAGGFQGFSFGRGRGGGGDGGRRGGRK